MWRSVASNGISLLIVLTLLLAGAILWGKREYSAEGPLSEAICVRVAQGETMRGVSGDLEAQGAVKSGALMRVGAEYTDRSEALKAGAFLVPARASMAEIVDIVTKGGASTCGTEIVYRVGVRASDILVRELDPASSTFIERAKFVPGEGDAPEAYADVMAQPDTRFRVAMAEGVTSWQVVQVLKAADILSGDVAGIPAEGTLAPDSYEVLKGDSRESVLERMAAQQSLRLQAAWESRADDLPFDTPQEALIMASIIEKETGVPDERGLVASVFENRLRRGMRLQTDPTVIYGITKGEGILDRGLRRSELDRVTPYNTYQIDGMPPTPIANPGRASIEAAVNPEVSDYVYFVADGSGGHAFAETLEQHNQNVAKWRRIEQGGANQ
ncbi:endolytic transglycosylase MltG [Pseudooceanicola sediminis]|uniref:Endolytic murein transglycosylase n=1 Tax=Pseudooceanicola sediminis TaxID=2211117 RepID=A0A399J3D1_9RHOB|nr:endolytic transglycosylase MltG [Pseudooceanicola sediminis]KAA2317418.1 endolytic transglycosylase MltG [Puniceibacterium sp. HSS470]RII39770.1 endolytic transglycosylase MltG [Pseudooceanicola sediminis]|tara:strand:- start:17411 stop:18565 length:1155 start_codon:yes stop_codon:yes gene_type:complete